MGRYDLPPTRFLELLIGVVVGFLLVRWRRIGMPAYPLAALAISRAMIAGMDWVIAGLSVVATVVVFRWCVQSVPTVCDIRGHVPNEVAGIADAEWDHAIK